MGAWERLPEEPEVAYARFLVYRNLGPARSLDAAYRSTAAKRDKSRSAPGSKLPRVSGQWQSDCSQYNWVERATAWDIAQLEAIVPGSIATIFKVIDEFAKATLQAIQAGKAKPKNWAQVMEAVNALSNFITPEAASDAITISRSKGDAAEDRPEDYIGGAV